jgi:hypothetical protein
MNVEALTSGRAERFGPLNRSGLAAAGEILDFSSRASSGRSRVVRPQPKKFEAVLNRFPQLAPHFQGVPPLFINAYPSSPGDFGGGTLIDTYTRPDPFAAALRLAAAQGRSAIVLAMPLTAAHLLMDSMRRGYRLPPSLVFGLGGYPGPPSLERYLIGLAKQGGANAAIVHLYGVGEIGAALLAAADRAPDGTPIYHSIDTEWAPRVVRGRLAFVRHDDPAGIPTLTEEWAAWGQGGLLLRNDPKRLDPSVWNQLSAWSEPDWARRTGFVATSPTALRVQLRAGVSAASEEEVDYFTFARSFPSSWLEKPCWCGGADQ